MEERDRQTRAHTERKIETEKERDKDTETGVEKRITRKFKWVAGARDGKEGKLRVR